MRRFLIPGMPLAVHLLFFTATIAVGAIYFLSDAGATELWNFLGSRNADAAQAIGSFPYMFLTLGPYPIVTAFAVLGIAAVRRFIPRRIRFKPAAPAWAIWTLAICSFAFCLYQLSVYDALLPVARDYRQNILHRTFLYNHLGLAYFVCTYAILPISAVMFMSRAASERRVFDFIGLLISTLAFDYLVLAIYTKSHLLVFAIMLASAVIFCRMRLYWIPVIVALAFATFLPAEYVLSGIAKIPHTDTQQRTIVAPDPTVVLPESHMPAIAPTVPPSKEVTMIPQNENTASSLTFWQDVIYFKYFITQAMSLRMAAAVPFYVSIFEDPSQRCGIEAHTLRKLLGIQDSDCILPVKVFSVMYPSIKWVVGFAPAGASISAYAELGLTWSAFVMAMSGLVLGIIGGLIALGEGPIFVAIGVAACTFGYYLTQLPFFGSFTYPYGLIFFTIPIAFVFLAGFLTRLSITKSSDQRRF